MLTVPQPKYCHRGTTQDQPNFQKSHDIVALYIYQLKHATPNIFRYSIQQFRKNGHNKNPDSNAVCM